MSSEGVGMNRLAAWWRRSSYQTKGITIIAALVVLAAIGAAGNQKPTSTAGAGGVPTAIPEVTVGTMPVTPQPAPTAKPAKPTTEPSTSAPVQVPTATPVFLRDPVIVAALLESQYGISFTDSPLQDGTVRKLGHDETRLVIVELTDDPIKSVSVSGPIPGSGTGTDATIGNVLGAEAAVFGSPKGLTDWLIAQMTAAGPSKDVDLHKRFGNVVARLQWFPTTLGYLTISMDLAP
jgi:hypothetical protein